MGIPHLGSSLGLGILYGYYITIKGVPFGEIRPSGGDCSQFWWDISIGGYTKICSFARYARSQKGRSPWGLGCPAIGVGFAAGPDIAADLFPREGL